jgi:ATP/maltotriose-dependent transcriptional regulator MalT
MVNHDDDSRMARALLEESLSLRRTLGDRRNTANSLQNLGLLVAQQGNFARAGSLLEESLALWRELGDIWGQTAVLRMMAELAITQGDVERGRRNAEESLNLARQSADTQHVAVSLAMLGYADLLRGNLASARAQFDEGLDLLRKLGSERSVTYGVMLVSLARIALKAGDNPRAESLLRDCLSTWREHGFRGAILAETLEVGAALAVAQGRPARALRLAGSAAALRASVGIPMRPVDQTDLVQLLGPVRQGLGEAEATRAWASGQAMTPEQAITFAQDGEAGHQQ